MDLKHLVRINEEGIVADAVNFGMIEDEPKNLSLCNGFVFNYEPASPKSSTVGVLECIRRSFFSPSEPNVHLVVQDYGKGKSHFALVTANYFRKAHDSHEVKGILRQVEVALGGKKGILEDLRGHKERSRPYLVITVSGERQVDLKQMLLRQIRKTLQADGVTDSIAQHLCEKPLEYLQGLTPDQRADADNFLRQNTARYGQIDTASLIKVLEGDGYQEIPTTIDISRHLTGFPFDFSADLSVEEILEDLLKKLCTGKDCRYQGILILFDELNVYLQSWATNPASAGGMTLQNVTNVCENHKGRIALACFTQIKPSHAGALPSNSSEVRDYQKLTSRLELGPSTYEPMSSLELVLDNLINPQDRERLQEFMTTWRGSLQRDSELAFERCTIYQQRRWPFADFLQHLGQGSFPLHPLAAYLLCNLDFMQGRTAIQFVKENVKHFIATEAAEKNGFLNYIRPVELVDAFHSNLSNHPLYPDFEKAVTAIQASATEDDLTILKALFLFYIGGGKLKKPDTEPHEHLLASLCGMTPDHVRDRLQLLAEQLGVIYHVPGTLTYRFYSGVGLNDLRRMIDDEISQSPRSIESVVSYVQEHLTSFLKVPYVDASQFVAEQRLVEDDWRFAIRVCAPDEVRDLLAKETLENSKFKGVVAFAFPTTSSDAQLLRVECEDALKQSAVRSRVIVAVPKQGLGEVADLILRVKALERKSVGERERYGTAHVQLLRIWKQEIEKRLGLALSDFILCSSVADRIPISERNDWHAVASVLLRDLYGAVPTLENVDRLRSGNKTGAKIVSYMVKQLYEKALSKQSFPDNSFRTVIDSVFLRAWGLLRLSGSQYSVQVPTNPRVKVAWDALTAAIPLSPQKETRTQLNLLWTTLSSEPFGYSDLTFTALLGAWMVFNRTELRIAVVGRLNGQPSQMEEFTVAQFLSRSEFETPSKFVSAWQRDDLFLIRRSATSDVTVPERMAIDEARECVSKIQEFLSREVPNQARAAELKTLNNILVLQISQIERWEQSWRKLMSDLNPSELPTVVDAYVKLQMCPDFSGKLPEVTLTRVLKAEQVHTLEQLRAIIRDRVVQFDQRANTLNRDQELRANSAQIDRDLVVLKRVPALFEGFAENLSSALLATERRIASIQDQRQYDDCIANIKRVVNAIGPTTNQSALINSTSSIEDLVARYPDAGASEEYRAAIGQIEKYQREQRKNISGWKTRAEQVDSKRAAETLLAEVTSARDRFDFDSDATQIDQICKLLALTAEQFGIVETADQQLHDYIAAVRRLSERIFNSKEIESGITFYRELLALRCVAAEESPNCETVEAEASEIRKDTRGHLTQLVGAMYSRVPEALEECHRLRDQMEGVLEEFSSMRDFSDLVTPIRKFLQTLGETTRIIELRGTDQHKLARIRNLQRTAPNTLQLCEAAIAEIKELQQTLNFPESHGPEIEEIVVSLERRQAELGDRLSEIARDLSALSSYDAFKSLQRTYDQLEMVFDGSNREQDYRALESNIIDLRRMFERLDGVEARSIGATTVKRFQECLQELEVSPDFQNLPVWANERLVRCQNKLRERVSAAGEQLVRWNSQLASLSTQKDVESSRSASSAKASLYAESEMSDLHRQLTVDLLALSDCLRVQATAAALQTEIDCEKALGSATEWRAAHEGSVSPVVIQRALLVEKYIADRGESLKNERVREWRRWVKVIEDRAEAVRAMPESPVRSENAATLLKEITGKPSTFSSDIEGAEVALLESVQSQCTQILNFDREAQIFLLFDQLPGEVKRTLCRRLAERIGIEFDASEEIAASQRGN